MSEFILEWLHNNPEFALLVVPALAFLEAFVGVGLFISGIILLSVCSLLYVQEIASLAEMLPLAFVGASLSDHLGYYFGRWVGPRFHETRLAIRRRALLDRVETLFRRYGAFAIVIGRFLTPIRSLVPLLTGVSGMRRLRYSLFDLLACTIWTTGLGLLIVGVDKLA